MKAVQREQNRQQNGIHIMPHFSFASHPIPEHLQQAGQFRFLGNSPPTPPLIQHFALSEKQVLMVA